MYTIAFSLDNATEKKLKEFLKEKSIEDFVQEHLHAVISAVTFAPKVETFITKPKSAWKAMLGL